MLVLGLDPGYGRLGYAVVEEKGSSLRALDFGVLETSAKLSFERRLLLVHDAILKLAKEYSFSEAVLETLYFAKNAKTAIAVAEARGVIRLALAQADLPVYECQPNQIKLALCGDGKAGKVQVTRMVTRLLNLSKAPKLDDAADALALAITGLRSRNFRRLTALAAASKVSS
jgi:crossover junction endodeoxyribonuclease RuvC